MIVPWGTCPAACLHVKRVAALGVGPGAQIAFIGIPSLVIMYLGQAAHVMLSLIKAA